MKALMQSPLRQLVMATFLACAGLALSAPGFVSAQDEKKDVKGKLPGGLDVDEILKKLPPNTPKEQADRIRQILEENRRRMDEAQKRADDMVQQRGKFQRFPGRFGGAEPQNRLGVRFTQPDDTLIAQLGLAEGNGLVLAEVPENSVAAKAGFQANDILLRLGGKDVSSTLIEFTTALGAIKTDTPIDAVVLRKGKEETIKGIKLPENPAEQPRVNPFQRRNQFNIRPPRD